MKKRLIAMALISCLMCTPITTYAEEVNVYEMSLEELQNAYLELQEKYNALLSESGETNATAGTTAEHDFEYTAKGFTYKYLNNEVKEVNGTNYVFVFFEYTNNSGETSTPYYSLTVSAFQNGIAMQSYISINDEVPEAELAFKEIKTGTTANIAYKFELSDDSPISLEIHPMFSFGDTEIGEFTFELNE